MRALVVAAALVLVVNDAMAAGFTAANVAPEVEQNQGGQLSAWGLGVGIGTEFYRDDYIKKATLIGTSRTVIVEESYSSNPSIWATGSWTPYYCGFLDPLCRTTAKPGLYVGLKLAGAESALDAFSVGVQITVLERGEGTDSTGKKVSVFRQSWVIGAGWVNHATQRLAEGITAGQPLPTDYSDIVYHHDREDYWMVMVTKVLSDPAD